MVCGKTTHHRKVAADCSVDFDDFLFCIFVFNRSYHAGKTAQTPGVTE
jgi:hypothetical protein